MKRISADNTCFFSDSSLYISLVSHVWNDVEAGVMSADQS